MIQFNNLWLVRAYPEGVNRIEEFKDEGVIGIGWSNIPNVENVCRDKTAISNMLSNNGYNNSNVTVGVLNHFFNNMQINDLCLIPDGNRIYLAKITSDYHYEDTKLDDGYAHQRSVEFLNKDNPINRSALPINIQKSLNAQNTIANLEHRVQEFKEFLESENTLDANSNLKQQLLQLVPKAIENLKADLECDDPERKTKASLEIIKLAQQYQS